MTQDIIFRITHDTRLNLQDKEMVHDIIFRIIRDTQHNLQPVHNLPNNT